MLIRYSNDSSKLPGFTVSHDLYSSYAFATLSSTITVQNGDATKTVLACVSASITPYLGQKLKDLLTYIPLAILILVGLATVFAATYSPWGSTDTFRWTANYGRDEDLLRLVTPGFADCLNYIQFIVLTGSLSLNYPGFYQPVVRSVSWSALMFNYSFVTHGNGTQSLQDGIYVTNATYGLERMSQLVGMTSTKDMWAGMVVWLLVIIGSVLVLTQIGFGLRWIYRQIARVPEEDLRAKNIPFSIGNVLRIIFNYLALPIISISMFQFVLASRTPAWIVVLAVILLVVLAFFTIWLILLIAKTRPRSYLFDDLSTVLVYGPLYNTYCDDAAIFALVPIFLNFLRGIAIGAVQPSGIAQLVLLAICEVVLALTLNAFRPFPSPTSMNIYHTCLALVRLISLLLSVAFVPSLGVTEPTRGWIGYIILLMHATALVIGFFLNAVQTIIEVGARLAGAGGEMGGVATRGGLAKVLGMRQLARRAARPRAGTSTSYAASDAAMLGPENDQKSFGLEGGRSRSMSASSRRLLNSDGHNSMAFENTSTGFGHRTSGSGQFTPTTPGAGSTLSKQGPSSARQSTGGIIGIKQAETANPYYRPPRDRRNTLDAPSPSSKGHGSWGSGDWVKSRFTASPNSDNAGEGPSGSGRGTPIPPRNGTSAEWRELEDIPTEYNPAKQDYSVREVDLYYGVRGPALKSTGGTRKLKTGPADPTGPVSSATGWFKSLWGGKTKDKGKGFEVIRSSRAPPPGLIPRLDDESSPEPYKDDPNSPTKRGVSRLSESADIAQQPRAIGGAFDESSSGENSDPEDRAKSRVSPIAPSLPVIDTVGDIEMPSRVGSKASKASRERSLRNAPPTVPRRSSKRQSLIGSGDFGSGGFPAARLSTVAGSPPPSPQTPRRLPNHQHGSERHLNPTATGRLPFEPSKSAEAESATSSLTPVGDEENQPPESGRHARHSSSALGSLAPDIRSDRPSSVGYVAQHRAGENIHEASPDSPEFLGSSAEFIGRAQ